MHSNLSGKLQLEPLPICQYCGQTHSYADMLKNLVNGAVTLSIR